MHKFKEGDKVRLINEEDKIPAGTEGLFVEHGALGRITYIRFYNLEERMGYRSKTRPDICIIDINNIELIPQDSLPPGNMSPVDSKEENDRLWRSIENYSCN